MRNLIPYLIVIVFFFIILIGVEFSSKKEINYEQKYDSLHRELKQQQLERDSLSNTVDFLLLVSDSLKLLSSKIEIRIRDIPGKYKTFNSEELRNKMIEAYELRN